MKSKAVVLLSAGLDSAYNLFRAKTDLEVFLALTFNYGQRAAIKEIERASALAKLVGVPHQVIELPWFKIFTRTSLVGGGDLPLAGAVSIDDLQVSEATAKAVWVPNRNGIFLNIAAGFAEGFGADTVIPGFNLEEATTFPDNSYPFMKALDESLKFSTANQVKVHCYSVNMDKTEIVKDAIRLKLPFEKLWPCYQAKDEWCGWCESCQRFERALSANGVKL